jgi:hypothetical protein
MNTRSATQRRAAEDAATDGRSSELALMLETFEARSADAVRFIRTQLDERPLATLMTGAAVGWVLGGGLSLRTGGFLLDTAGRAAIASALSAAIKAANEGVPR